MLTEETLQEFVAALSRTEKALITAATPIDRLLPGSLGRTRLDAALRNRLGVSNTKIYQAVTFGDLCRVLDVSTQNGAAHGEAPSKPEEVRAELSLHTSNGARAAQVGIDLEPIAALPAAKDYWDDEFYKSTFTSREIAYALLQPSPQATFAGIWCAKEALRKAEPALAEALWTSLEVVHDASGRPSMAVDGKPTGGALSVSHAGEMAVAVFVCGEPAPATRVNGGDSASSNSAESAAQSEKSGRWTNAVALLALLISLAALAATFLRH
jgi:phosphopantetheine--protein transferase-like protein